MELKEGDVMFYCEDCRMLMSGDICLHCGKKLREPNDDDPCFLIEKEEIWSEALKEILENHQIPYYVAGSMGAGMALRVGPMLETYQFYVPYSSYEQAKECINHMFNQE